MTGRYAEFGTYSLPIVLVPCRGDYREVVFTSLGDGTTAWWFVDQSFLPDVLSDHEAAVIDGQVTLELQRRQQEWRDAAEAKRAGWPFGDPLKRLGALR